MPERAGDDVTAACSCGDPTRLHINHRKRIPCWTYIGSVRHNIGEDGHVIR